MWQGGASLRALRSAAREWLGKRRALVTGVGAGLGLVLAACLALGPIVRSRAEAAGHRRGLRVEVGSVRPNLMGVTLKNVRFVPDESEGTPWLSGQLDRVEVHVGLGLGLRSVRVQGGHVTLTGSPDEIGDHLRDMRKNAGRAPAAESGGPSEGPEIVFEGLRVSWAGAADAGGLLEAEGIRFEQKRPEQGVVNGTFTVDSAHASREGQSARAKDLTIRFARQRDASGAEENTSVSEARLASLELGVELSLGNVPAPPPPAAAPAPRRVTTPTATKPSRRGARAQPPLPPRPAFVDFDFSPKARRLRDQLVKVSAWCAEHLTDGAPVEINGLQVVLTRGDQKLNIGPGSLHVLHGPKALDIDFAPGRTGARVAGDPTNLSMHATIPSSNGEIAVNVSGGPVTLASLGVKEQDFGLLDVANAKLEAKGNVRLSDDAGRFLFDGDGRLSSLSLFHHALADEPVRGIDMAWRAAGSAELNGSSLRLDEGRIDVGAIHLQASGAAERGDDYVRIEARADVPVSDCKKMLDSLPRALVPKLEDLTLAGTFALRAGIALDTRRLEDMKVEWDLKNRCRVKDVPADFDVDKFTKPFRRTVYDEHGEKVEVVAGPSTPDWVPFAQISPFMEVAVTTTEDGGFRRHGGFDRTAIQNSIRDNLRAGRFLRGASTITMQLAKNIYLDREKSLSRKLQEAILTTYLEQALTKDEILELYFNVVEFGPNLYGIGPAATYYFNTIPNELSLGQSLFLTSLLPNPKRNYFTQTGLVSKGWLGYLHRVMKIMRERNKINDEEFMDGLSEVLTYQVPRSPRVRPSPEEQHELVGDMPWLAPDGP
ncbi:MAG TPA: biosynthetic peptidoglycan transglycosylase [Polyangiaceae bacterium]